METKPLINSYLRAIGMLSQRYYCVRAVDIARYLGCSKPSVSLALKQLSAQELISREENGAIILTPKGRQASEYMNETCDLLAAHLRRIGVDADTAEREACAMLRALSPATLDLIRDKAGTIGAACP